MTETLEIWGIFYADWANLSYRKSVSRYYFRLAKDNPMIL